MGLFSRIARAFQPAPSPSSPPAPPSAGGFQLLARGSYEDEQKRETVAAPPYIRTLSDWDVDTVKAALDAHEKGIFSQSGLLWQWMQRDPRLRTVMGVRTSGLPRLPLTFEAAEHDPPEEEATLAADRLEAEWYRSFPESTLRKLHGIAVGMGLVVARIGWKVGRYGYWWPKLQVWPPEAIRWDETGQCFYAMTRQGGEVKVESGNGEWLLWMPDGERGFQLGAVMALALPVLISDLLTGDAVNLADAYGHPVRKAIVPRGASTTEKNTYLANLAALGRETSSILCQKNLDGSGFDFEFVTLESGGTVAVIEEGLDRADLAKSTVILGQSLTTDVADSGSRALGDVHKEIKAEILAADAEGFSTVVWNQVVRWWAKYNFGKKRLAPTPHWEAKPPKDMGAEADAHVKATAAITAIEAALAGTPKKLDRLKYLEALDLPLVDVDPALAAAAPAPKAKGGVS